MTWCVTNADGARITAPMLNPAVARLCASAPDLLDACRECLALLTDPDADPWQADRVEARLRQAIDRATGGAA